MTVSVILTGSVALPHSNTIDWLYAAEYSARLIIIAEGAAVTVVFWLPYNIVKSALFVFVVLAMILA